MITKYLCVAYTVVEIEEKENHLKIKLLIYICEDGDVEFINYGQLGRYLLSTLTGSKTQRTTFSVGPPKSNNSKHIPVHINILEI